jgi:hypothetical protein
MAIYPQVIQQASRSSIVVSVHPAEEPQISCRIHPGNGALSRPRHVAGSSGPLGPVRTGLVGLIGSAYPRPFASAVHPQVVEEAGRCIRVDAGSTEEPQGSRPWAACGAPLGLMIS